MPSLSSRMTFRDGGETGETIIQRIVESLPRYLEPGGMFCSVTAGADLIAAPFEKRVREWLGGAPPEVQHPLPPGHLLSPQRLTHPTPNPTSEDGPAPTHRAHAN